MLPIKHVDLLLIEEEKSSMLLSISSVNSYMIIHFILKENIFVVIVYTRLLQKKY